jgi:predicted site-specific integrase-resolvase
MAAPNSFSPTTTRVVGAEADRLTRLGAKQIRSLAENNNRWISFIDPEGNGFDLVAG